MKGRRAFRVSGELGNRRPFAYPAEARNGLQIEPGKHLNYFCCNSLFLYARAYFPHRRLELTMALEDMEG